MIYLSICSRKENTESETLKKLLNYSVGSKTLKEDGFRDKGIETCVEYNAPSIYEGHKANIDKILQERPWGDLNDDDVIVFIHDDVEILSDSTKFNELIGVARKPGVGFIGVAGATNFTKNGAWWTARQAHEARGFVWQGDSDQNMVPNYFGKPGQVVVLDGCLIAATYQTIKAVGLDQPDYLSSGWDFYDIHLTFSAHYKGYSNYVVPIMIRHESSGHMRQDWYQAKDEFMKEWKASIPCRIPVDKTNGLPL